MSLMDPTSPMVVMKFGGSCLTAASDLKRAAQLVSHKIQSGFVPIVVVSALQGFTDDLLNKIESVVGALGGSPYDREMDRVLATGEHITAGLMAKALKGAGVRARSLGPSDRFLTVSGPHGRGIVKRVNADAIVKYCQAGMVPVLPGFQGVNESGEVTTLGRGGSDTTAVATAIRLSAVCELYKDVGAVYSKDPGKQASAEPLKSVSHTELTLLMNQCDHQVIQSEALELAHQAGIDIYVKPFNHHNVGTVVSSFNPTLSAGVAR